MSDHLSLPLCQMPIRCQRWSTLGLRELLSLWWWQRMAPDSTSTILLGKLPAQRTYTPAEVCVCVCVCVCERERERESVCVD